MWLSEESPLEADQSQYSIIFAQLLPDCFQMLSGGHVILKPYNVNQMKEAIPLIGSLSKILTTDA